MSSRYPGFGSRSDDNESHDNFVTIGTHFDPAEPTNSTSILATLGRKASKLVDLSSSNYGYDGKRFHGAFTGGFNAGFYNTVGSIEGWRPGEFISSRTSRAEKRVFEPEDFMDKGDFSEHGINPKQIKIRNQFDQNDALTRTTLKTQPSSSSSSNQRSKDDILRDMIRIKTLSIGKKILMSMGWKPGEGVGVKMSRKHRKKLKSSLIQEPALPTQPAITQSEPENPPGVKVYGVAMPPPSYQQTTTKTSRLDVDDDDDDDYDNQIYASVNLPPLDYEVHFQLQKQEHHGLGYKGLESLNLFTSQNLFVQPTIEKQINNVKIRGQAFGVGIEEDEDDRDLYATDDLKQYDYELTVPNDNVTDIMKLKSQQFNFSLKFVRYESMSMTVNYPPPTLPIDFRIGHRFPKSAMPVVTAPSTSDSGETQSIQSSVRLDANARGILLGDLSFLSRPPPNVNVSVPPPPVPLPQVLPKEEIIESKHVPATPSLEWDVEKERKTTTTTTTTTTRTTTSTSTSANNPRTQFLDAVKNRFTTSSDCQQMIENQTLETALENDLKKAAAMNLYGGITRSMCDWKPNPLLCKRMNVPNPYPDEEYDDSKESKKSRRQMCSNLFEHLFVQSSDSTEAKQQPTATLPSSSSSSSSNPNVNETIVKSVPIPSAPLPTPSQQPTAPKLDFAPINSYEQETQERPPLDFFSAIFDNDDSGDSDNDTANEQEQEKPVDQISKPIIIQSSNTFTSQPAVPPPSKARDIKYSESSDSSIEEVEISIDKPLSTYGPTVPPNLASHSTTSSNRSIWAKLADTSAQYEELKKKKHKKKKKHHKKSKKHDS